MNQATLNLPNPQDWVSVEQALEILGINRSTLYAMIKDGRLGDYQIGSLRVIWRNEARELAEALRKVRPPRV